MRWFSMSFLWITGWRTEGQPPIMQKFVLVVAPHTSNWDFPYGLFIALILRVKTYWLGKEALFRMPLKGFFKYLGGIPVDRSKSSNVVDQSIKRFHENERFILTIAPAGTRKKVKNWKTGFYNIATGANVPIVLGFLDYQRKVGGIGPAVYPTGVFGADIKIIRAFYDGIIGKYPDKTTTHTDKGASS